MGRSQETFNKKEVRNKKEKKRKEKEKKRLARKESDKVTSSDDMIAYVDENGMITDTPPDPSKKRDIKLEDIEIGVPSREADEDFDPVRKGIVSFFNDSKGFGFIKDSETKQGVFVHINNVLEDIKEGNVVSYEVEMGHKGPAAVRVHIFREKPAEAAPVTTLADTLTDAQATALESSDTESETTPEPEPPTPTC